MAKIPVILEAGRADGKLVTTNSIFDENKSMFQSEINDIQDTLNSDNSNKPLSAKQGKVLKELLDAKVIEAGAVPIDSEPIEGNITHVVNSDGLAKEFNKYNTSIITTDRIKDGAVTSEKIATSAFDSTLFVSGKIAPADVVGTRLNKLDKITAGIERNNVETINSFEITDDKDNAIVSVDDKGVHLETISGFDADSSIEILKNNTAENSIDFTDDSDNIIMSVDENGVHLDNISGNGDVNPSVNILISGTHEKDIIFEDDNGNAVTIINKSGLWAKKISDGEHEFGEIIYPMTFLPSIIYGIVGMPQRLYVRGICGGINPYIFYNKFGATNLSSVSNSAKVYRRYVEIIPNAEGICEISHCLMDDKMNASTPITASYVVKNAPTSISSRRNILCVGASTTAGGQWVNELKRMLTSVGERPSASTLPSDIGLNLSNINFVGRLFKNGINLEATGGWTWQRYVTATNVSFRVQVQNQTNVVRGDLYSIVGTDGKEIYLTIAEENLTEGTGNILLNKEDGYSKNVPIEGTLTKIRGEGQVSIPYTDAVEESYSPFFNSTTNQVDFVQYANLYCDGAIDICIVFLSPYNDGITGNESLDGIMKYIETFVNALRRDFPNCKIVLIPNIGINVLNGIEYNESLSKKQTTCSIRRILFRYTEMLNNYTKTIDNCYMVNSMCEVDQDNVFPIGNRVVNYRSSDTEIIGTNGVHPTNTGYLMLADSVFRCLCHII